MTFPVYGQAWLCWIGMVPLLLSLDRMRPGPSFWSGWAAGVAYWAVFLPWIKEVHSVSWVAIYSSYLYLGVYFGLFCFLMSLLRRRLHLPFISGAPLWVALEYLRSHFFFLAFPFALLGHSQYHDLPLIQMASWTGVYGLSFLLVLANGALADLIALGIHLKREDRPYRSAVLSRQAIILLLVVVCTALLWVSGKKFLSKEKEGESTIKIAVVQGNILQNKKWDKKYKDSIFSRYEALSLEAAESKPRLIVWPETATPGFILKDMALLRRMVDLTKRAHAYFLVGSAEYPKFSKVPLERERNGNTAIYFTPEGKVQGQYLKTRLLPFGEYVPYSGIIPWPRCIVPPEKKNFLIRGKGPVLLDLGGPKVGPLICWENVFPELSRRLVEEGADIIVNISNEAWFGKTAAPYQILSMCVFRAVENRVPMVRATNTGISCFIGPTGQVTGVVKKGDQPLFVEGVQSHAVALSKPGSFYTRNGDILAFGCVAFSLLIMLWSLLAGIRETSRRDTHSAGGNT